MTVKRYFAASARDCLRKVKEDLGPDAIVVSNKAVRGGVEITAMSAESLDALSSQGGSNQYQEAATPRMLAAGGSRFGVSGYVESVSSDDYTVSLSAQARKQATIKQWQPPRYESAGNGAPLMPAAVPVPVESPRAGPAPDIKSRAVRREPESEANVSDLTREIQDIRSLLEQQLAGFAWGELSRTSPVRAQLMAELLETGFSALLARRMTQDQPAGITLDEGRRRVATILDRRLRMFDSKTDPIDRGGIYALVGPTGVGKTTTTAKLAARSVVRYGADKVALLTTDGYRIGAVEQLRIYGRILGIPVHAVNDGHELRQTLAALADKHIVLIDTVGMSQRDQMVAEQSDMLASSGDVKRLLLLNATSRGEMLDDVIRSYAGSDVVGCILSKIDETTTLAPVIDAAVRHDLPVAYLANGQRVPEDLHLPNRKYILHRVFKQPAGNMAHRFKEEEVGMALGRDPAASMTNDAFDSGSRLG